jgi:hypothetical protein
MIAYLFIVGGATFAFGLGLIAGMLLRRDASRPAVTPWGESTALWSETDWDWWKRCGRHSDSAWAAETRRAQVERIARMAGADLEGSIIPDTAGSIDRTPKTWWTN